MAWCTLICKFLSILFVCTACILLYPFSVVTHQTSLHITTIYSDWVGSGEKATPEQESEIPPIHSIETDEGYAQAAAALPDETVYAPVGSGGFAVSGGDSSNVQAGKSRIFTL